MLGRWAGSDLGGLLRKGNGGVRGRWWEDLTWLVDEIDGGDG